MNASDGTAAALARSAGAALVAGAVLLSSCSAQKSMSGWFGTEPSPSSGPSRTPVATGAGATYYVGAAGVRVFSEPSSRSKLVGTLAPYEKVTRTGIDRGYAYVQAKGGLIGWVDNAQLLWRLPAAGGVAPAAPPAAVEAAPPAAEPAPAVEEPKQPEASEMPAAAEPEPPPPAARPTPTRTPASGVAPSLFDSY